MQEKFALFVFLPAKDKINNSHSPRWFYFSAYPIAVLPWKWLLSKLATRVLITARWFSLEEKYTEWLTFLVFRVALFCRIQNLSCICSVSNVMVCRKWHNLSSFLLKYLFFFNKSGRHFVSVVSLFVAILDFFMRIKKKRHKACQH